MPAAFNISNVPEEKIISFPSGVDYIYTQISLSPGASDFRAVDIVDGHPTFAVQNDPIPRGELAASGATIEWQNLLVSSGGRWWNVIAIVNNSTVDISVVVKTKYL
jgi:hypothetical protein